MMTESEVRVMYLSVRTRLAALEAGIVPEGFEASEVADARIWLIGQRTALAVVLGERLDPETGEPIGEAV